jgi:hypothetical protein
MNVFGAFRAPSEVRFALYFKLQNWKKPSILHKTHTNQGFFPVFLTLNKGRGDFFPRIKEVDLYGLARRSQRILHAVGTNANFALGQNASLPPTWSIKNPVYHLRSQSDNPKSFGDKCNAKLLWIVDFPTIVTITRLSYFNKTPKPPLCDGTKIAWRSFFAIVGYVLARPQILSATETI